MSFHSLFWTITTGPETVISHVLTLGCCSTYSTKSTPTKSPRPNIPVESPTPSKLPFQTKDYNPSLSPQQPGTTLSTPKSTTLSLSSPDTNPHSHEPINVSNASGLKLVVDLSTPPKPPSPIKHTHPMTLRCRTKSTQPSHALLATHSSTTSEIEPTSFSQPNKSVQWHSAMADELNALYRNGTWTLVPPSPNTNVVGCKWVYRIKRKADGSLEHYKARLVAKGFS